MGVMELGRIGRWCAALALGFASLGTAQAADADFKSAFDEAGYRIEMRS